MLNTKKLHEIKPTNRWKKSSYPYTKDIIIQSEIILDDFINNLVALGDTPSSQNILACVKNVVLKFNELDEELSFIETVEREDLCDFIFIGARMAGLETDEDITSNWRDW